jgi:putative ABC transport system substrate-binding protein
MPFGHLRRREFITLVGGAVAWPLAARAQRPNRVWRIGVLSFGPPDSPYALAFRQVLRDLGYIEARISLLNTVNMAADGRSLPISPRS